LDIQIDAEQQRSQQLPSRYSEYSDYDLLLQRANQDAALDAAESATEGLNWALGLEQNEE